MRLYREGWSLRRLRYPPRTSFINAAEVKLINARIIGPVRSSSHDEAMLNRILCAPVRKEIYANEKDINELSATLASNLIKHPIFPTGNKRTALLATALFRLKNGYQPRSVASQAVGNDAMVEVHRGLETGEVDEAEYARVCSKLWKFPTESDDRERWSIREVKNGIVGVLESCINSTASDFTYTSTDLTVVFAAEKWEVHCNDVLVDHDYSGSVILRKAILPDKFWHACQRGLVHLESSIRPENGASPLRPLLSSYPYLVLPAVTRSHPTKTVIRAWKEEYFDYVAVEVGVKPMRPWQDISNLGAVFNKALRDLGNHRVAEL